MSGRGAPSTKSINLALQGGGAHGAFTWGVLDQLLEDSRISIEAISGTSAGAVNAVAAAQGGYEDGEAGARAHLRKLWESIGVSIPFSLSRSFSGDDDTSPWSLKRSPPYILFNLLSQVAAPKDFNPMGVNFLRNWVGDIIDFESVRKCELFDLFIAATKLETCELRVFERSEITLDVVMASAAHPKLFRPVHIDGEPYWDGGYVGNPPLFPFCQHSKSDDIVIVLINPIEREGEPATAQDIHNRVNEITMNSALKSELRQITLISQLVESGDLNAKKWRRMHLHMIDGCELMRSLDASSKFNTDKVFLQELFQEGRRAAEHWLENHYDTLGSRSSVDVEAMFGDGSLLTTLGARAQLEASA